MLIKSSISFISRGEGVGKLNVFLWADVMPQGLPFHIDVKSLCKDLTVMRITSACARHRTSS